jgi:hypothetical protein
LLNNFILRNLNEYERIVEDFLPRFDYVGVTLIVDKVCLTYALVLVDMCIIPVKVFAF